MKFKIWKKYFFKELFKVLLLFLASFYLLYVLIDYSSHAKAFHQKHISVFAIFSYYLLQFTKRADILLPIALLVSTIKVLAFSNLKGELTALVTGGIGLKRLLFPFFQIAFLCFLFCLVNSQLIIPSSLTWINRFEKLHLNNQKRKNKQIGEVLLDDQTLLVFQSYDPLNGKLFDVFWILSSDEIYRIKFLNPYSSPPSGEYVDHLVRNDAGQIVKDSSREKMDFPNIRFSTKKVSELIRSVESQSLSLLISKLRSKGILFSFHKMGSREAKAASFLYYKLFAPLACFLAILIPAPFFLRFCRHVPFFWYFAFSMVGMILFFASLSALRILGEAQVIPPLLAMLLSPLLFFGYSTYKLAKL